MNYFLFYFLLFLLNVTKEQSNEYYQCINPKRNITSVNACTSITIPDGYKCCAIKFYMNNSDAYNCIPLEFEYTENEETIKEYFANKSISSLFKFYDGKMEVECGENTKIVQEFKSLSDGYLNCYYNHLKGVSNESECYFDIFEEKSKCCYLETVTRNNKSENVSDSRCYLIRDEYFTEQKNLTDFLLEESNKNSLDEIKNIIIKSNCKGYETFYFEGEFEEISKKKNEENSEISAGIIILMVFGCLIGVAGLGFLFIYCKKKHSSLDSKKISFQKDFH